MTAGFTLEPQPAAVHQRGGDPSTPLVAVAGLDLLTASERAADAVLHAVLRRLPAAELAGSFLATHWARAGEVAHVALSVELAGVDEDAAWQLLTEAVLADHPLAEGMPTGDTTPAWALCLGDRCAGGSDLQGPAREAADAHARRRSGRVVHFPGVRALVGSMPVREVLARSAVDRVKVLAGGDADPETVLVTREHVRPTWSSGELVLLTQPAVGGTLVPFEAPDPTRCCADH